MILIMAMIILLTMSVIIGAVMDSEVCLTISLAGIMFLVGVIAALKYLGV